MYRKVERRGGASVETEQFSCAPFHHAGDGKKDGRREKERELLSSHLSKALYDQNLGDNHFANEKQDQVF